MSSTSEVSYGARIGNAESLAATLNNFNNYQPLKPGYSIESLMQLVNTIKGQNNSVAEKKQHYSMALENRIQIVTKGTASIEKALSPINSTVKAIYGKTSKEASDVAGIIAKFRGANIKKDMSTTPGGESVSQSYQSYNSKLQFFADLIANLGQFSNYQPVNANLATAELLNLYTLGVEANNRVADTFTQFSQYNAIRINSYKDLTTLVNGIKESVKAQYGIRSTEYTLIKGIKI